MIKLDTLQVSGSNHSRAYAEIVNLINMVNCHRKFCIDPDCGVTFYHTRETAYRLVAHVWGREKQDIILKITNTRWG